jgi:hypothetical protein
VADTLEMTTAAKPARQRFETPRTISAGLEPGASRLPEIPMSSGISDSLRPFPKTGSRKNWQIGGNSVISYCGCSSWSGRGRPADQRGARIETGLLFFNNDNYVVAPQINAGRGLKLQGPQLTAEDRDVAPQINAGRGLKQQKHAPQKRCPGRPADQRGARIETSLRTW